MRHTLGVSVRVFSDRINWGGGGAHSECGQHYTIGLESCCRIFDYTV